MVNKSSKTDMASNKWDRGIISMMHNEVVMAVSVYVEMDKNGDTRMVAADKRVK